jgi:hypothetical protein
LCAFPSDGTAWLLHAFSEFGAELRADTLEKILLVGIRVFFGRRRILGRWLSIADSGSLGHGERNL